MDREHSQGDLHENEKGTAVNTFATFARFAGRNPQGRSFAARGTRQILLSPRLG